MRARHLVISNAGGNTVAQEKQVDVDFKACAGCAGEHGGILSSRAARGGIVLCVRPATQTCLPCIPFGQVLTRPILTVGPHSEDNDGDDDAVVSMRVVPDDESRAVYFAVARFLEGGPCQVVKPCTLYLLVTS